MAVYSWEQMCILRALHRQPDHRLSREKLHIAVFAFRWGSDDAGKPCPLTASQRAALVRSIRRLTTHGLVAQDGMTLVLTDEGLRLMDWLAEAITP